MAEIFDRILQKSMTRYDKPFLFAVGDGNHSLAAAKAVWDEYKAAHAGEAGIENHPARWALVEVVNLYDPALAFRPIYRIVFGLEAQKLKNAFGAIKGLSVKRVGGKKELMSLVGTKVDGAVRFGIITGNDCDLAEFPGADIATVYVEPVLDQLMRDGNGSVTVDYIHGEAELFALAAKGEGAGILLPPVDRKDLFGTVAKSGPLPRKSFSLGEAREKRFYLECRRLF
jgi:uncharacterized protein (DUF1015 family)